MKNLPISTSLFKPGDNLDSFLTSHIPSLKEGCVVVLSSKILSIAQNRLVPMPRTKDDFLKIVKK